MADPLIQIDRPALGRPADKRVTADYLNTRGLAGNPFNPATDVDLVDGINNALAQLHTTTSNVASTAKQASLAATGGLPEFQSSTAAVPRNPTAAELLAYDEITGFRLNGTQLIRWNRSTSLWVDYGLPLADAATAQKGVSALNALGNTLTGLATKAQADGRQFADGSFFDWQTTATADPANVFAASGGGYWVRIRTARVWDAIKYSAYVNSVYGGDWGAGLTFINSLMADGDVLRLAPFTYTSTSRAIFATPITFDCPGAVLDVNYVGIGVDLLPGGVHENGAPRTVAGVGFYGIEHTYRGLLPRVVKRFALRGLDGSIGVRGTNIYYGKIDVSQGIQGFDVGFRANAQNAAGDGSGNAGFTYTDVILGRMENNINVYIGFTVAGSTQYVTQCNFYSGSFSNATYTTDYSGSHHIYIDGSTQAGMCNNITFHQPSMEGYQKYAVTVTGKAEQIFVTPGGRGELSAGLIYAVNLGPDTIGCDIAFYLLGSYIQQGKINDQGHNNKLHDNGYPAGDLNYIGGLSTIAGKYITYQAPINWIPVDVDLEPALVISYVPGAATVVVDLRVNRKVQINVTAAGAIGQVVSFINPPYVGYKVRVILNQFTTAPTSISGSFMSPINYSGQAAPVPRASGIDRYLLEADGYAIPTFVDRHTFN